MKRVLLIAYYFPPQPKAGALRAEYLAKNLPHAGWQPTVLTVSYPGQAPDGFDVVSARDYGPDAATPPSNGGPAGGVRKQAAIETTVKSLIKSVVYFPDNHVGWLIPAVNAARRAMRAERFDAVLSTAPPFTAHFIARKVTAGTNVPWIADYRDLWSGPPGRDYLHGSGPLRLRIEYAIERWLLRSATYLTATSEAQAEALSENFGRRDVACIPNAVDAGAWDSIPDSVPRDFTICYTGKLWPGLRMPDAIFASAARLRTEGDPAGLAVSFDFYGEDADLVMERARAFGVADIVRAHGEVNRTRALTAQREAAALLLLLDTEDTADAVQLGNPGSKVFEYAGARRPILAFGRRNTVVEDMLLQSGLGSLARDEATFADQLRELHRRFCDGIFEPPMVGNWTPMTPRRLGARFAEVLDAALQPKPAAR
ncbi:MAG TPA: glycosyltransferase [Candidatus Eremiobacteraceae bacterium]|nr:glycosyltransferase [Candidatus Eremiobacteraceae bacterium]